MFVVSLLLNLGMWLERWMIVTPTLATSYYPFAFDVMWPSMVQWAIVFGSFGWFGLLRGQPRLEELDILFPRHLKNFRATSTGMPSTPCEIVIPFW